MKIVIVDIDKSMRTVLRTICEAEGHEVVAEFGDGYVLLDYVMNHHPDVVCLDFNLPGQDGLELLVEMDTAVNHVGVIMMTGSDDPELKGHAADLGATGFIHKPFERAQVIDELKAMDKTRRIPIRASALPSSTTEHPAIPQSRTLTPLLDLQLRLNVLLRRPEKESFLQRLAELDREMIEHIDADSDRVLLTLIDHSSTELHQYSSTHSLLVMVLCQMSKTLIAAGEDQIHRAMRLAALTMNISIIDLQDELSQQLTPLSPDQKERIVSHAAESENSLRSSLGCTEPLWLESVKRHHDAIPGALSERTPAQRIARLIQRADLFAARISPRKTRPAMSAATAAQVAYLGEDGKPDEAGAALIKAIGIYPPGCWVGLGSGELAIVLRRGSKAHCPVVVAFFGLDGMPLPTPRVRDTESERYNIRASLPPGKIKFRPNLATLLNMI